MQRLLLTGEQDGGWTHILPDVGCEVVDSCFDCPLPQCKYDDPAAFLSWRRSQRDQRITQAVAYWQAQGAKPAMAVAITAGRQSITMRTVWRALARSRSE